MPVFGIKKKDEVFTVTAVKMQYDFRCGIVLKDGKYSAFARFLIDGDAPYEDIELEIRMLDCNATYVDMAKDYRKYQLGRGACIPLKERVKSNPKLKYGAESVLIRIRQAWKRVPAKVLVQTEEKRTARQGGVHILTGRAKLPTRSKNAVLTRRRFRLSAGI
ncbi:MAG: hypothetical protein L6V93_22000 [Clostridiales bacterium]|nr:MAG: hypothetical protein L6V93_22000 [Clostridiales bacterium]